MAIRCGTKTDPPAGQREDAPGRWIRRSAFLGLAGLAMAILAAVVLLPDYARLRRLQHQRRWQELRVQEARASVAGMDRLLADLPTDEVLTKRLAWSKLGMMPSNEAWPIETRLSAPPAPGTLSPVRYPEPPAPNRLWNSLARQLQRPAYHHSLLLLAGGMLISAFLLFAPPRRTVT